MVSKSLEAFSTVPREVVPVIPQVQTSEMASWKFFLAILMGTSSMPFFSLN